jgi:hypothetical protein
MAILPTEEYLKRIRNFLPEAIKRYEQEVESIEAAYASAGAMDYSVEKLSGGNPEPAPMKYAAQMELLRKKHLDKIYAYQEARAEVVDNINKMKEPGQAETLYKYIILNKTWEEIAVDKWVTYEAVRNQYYRGIESYIEQFGPEVKTDIV